MIVEGPLGDTCRLNDGVNLKGFRRPFRKKH
jgi:hypothetical protein